LNAAGAFRFQIDYLNLTKNDLNFHLLPVMLEVLSSVSGPARFKHLTSNKLLVEEIFSLSVEVY